MPQLIPKHKCRNSFFKLETPCGNIMLSLSDKHPPWLLLLKLCATKDNSCLCPWSIHSEHQKIFQVVNKLHSTFIRGQLCLLCCTLTLPTLTVLSCVHIFVYVYIATSDLYASSTETPSLTISLVLAS